MKKIRRFTHTGSTALSLTEVELRNRKVARDAAAQGIVLLANNGALPVKPGSRIALFGSGARLTVKGGTGSGDVNERRVVPVEQGLADAGYQITSGSWLDDYDAVYQKAREDWRAFLLGDDSEDAMMGFFDT